MSKKILLIMSVCAIVTNISAMSYAQSAARKLLSPSQREIQRQLDADASLSYKPLDLGLPTADKGDGPNRQEFDRIMQELENNKNITALDREDILKTLSVTVPPAQREAAESGKNRKLDAAAKWLQFYDKWNTEHRVAQQRKAAAKQLTEQLTDERLRSIRESIAERSNATNGPLAEFGQ